MFPSVTPLLTLLCFYLSLTVATRAFLVPGTSMINVLDGLSVSSPFSVCLSTAICLGVRM